MFWIRFMLLAASLATTGWYLDKEQRAGRLQHLDDLFLDFLAANARERLSTPAPGQPPQVAMVALREADRTEYSAWPPKPLDWQMLLKALQPHEPAVLVLTTPLNWGSPPPEFLPALAETLLPYTSVVSAVEATLADKAAPEAPPFMGGLADTLPHFQNVDGSPELAPALAALVAAPDPALRASTELGLEASRQDGAGWSLPYALRAEDRLHPSLLAQALARLTSTPYARHRVRLGPGAAAYLSGGLFVPLAADGTLRAPEGGQVPVINALDLMTGTLADTLSPDDKAALGTGRVIVVGLDHEDAARPRPALLHAQALAHLLTLPRLSRLEGWQQWAAWGLAALAAAWTALGSGGRHPLRSGLACVFMALLASFTAFHAALIWCPPAMPVALIATGALVGLVTGRRALEKEPAGQPPPAAAPDQV